jgi:hypothetical protein
VEGDVDALVGETGADVGEGGRHVKAIRWKRWWRLL